MVAALASEVGTPTTTAVQIMSRRLKCINVLLFFTGVLPRLYVFVLELDRERLISPRPLRASYRSVAPDAGGGAWSSSFTHLSIHSPTPLCRAIAPLKIHALAACGGTPDALFLALLLVVGAAGGADRADDRAVPVQHSVQEAPRGICPERAGGAQHRAACVGLRAAAEISRSGAQLGCPPWEAMSSNLSFGLGRIYAWYTFVVHAPDFPSLNIFSLPSPILIV